MGTVKIFTKEKLVIGLLISKISLKKSILNKLIKSFGLIDYESPMLDFHYTNYYDKEMGTPIKRFFISFKNLINPSNLAFIKCKTNKIEECFKEHEKRRVNLDPGLIDLSRFVLASTKDSSHRIPLKRGIFAEITLMYEKNQFRPVEWTYRDYQSKEYREILNQIRKIYVTQMKAIE